ncbi:MAG: tyrosine-type recombinase/integrase [Acidimicrobiales bacterium]
MTYIVQRKSRFYVVAYDGIDPITGREHRRWHPAGHSRADAEAIAANLDLELAAVDTPTGADPLTVARYLTEQWLPVRRHDLDPSTAHRYGWMIDHYITPAVGHLRLRSLRTEHLDRLYTDLLATGGSRRQGLAAKTVYDVHVICRAALNQAVDARLIATNPAHGARAPKPRGRRRHSPDCWTAHQLATFLDATGHLRLHPAFVVAATTGMRRGELAGLRWSDWNDATHTLSIARTRKSIGGRSVETPVKTRSSRRSIDLDLATEATLARWRRQQKADGHPVELEDPIFTNPTGRPLHPETISQLFARQVTRLAVPAIRFHDLRHTHATLLIAAGVPVKVVSERLGHANPGFTMATYQHVLPGMGADAANRFAALLTTNRDHPACHPDDDTSTEGR